jgi:hypothetical protein
MELSCSRMGTVIPRCLTPGTERSERTSFWHTYMGKWSRMDCWVAHWLASSCNPSQRPVELQAVDSVPSPLRQRPQDARCMA